MDRVRATQVGAFVLDECMGPDLLSLKRAMHPGFVFPEERSLLKSLRQSGRCLASLGEDHESRCIPVKSVDEADIVTPDMTARPVDEVHISGLLALTQKTGRFRDHQDVGVFEHDPGGEGRGEVQRKGMARPTKKRMDVRYSEDT